MSRFPERWATATLAEVNTFKSQTVDPSSNPETEYELYSVPAFPSGVAETARGASIGSTKQIVLPGDVLVCKINPRINRVWRVAPRGRRPQIASSEWIGVRAPQFDPRFLQYYFSSPVFRALLEEGVTGVGGSLTRAQPKRVATFPVPLASLTEQTRIADKLDCCLSRLSECCERLDRVPELLKRFREAVLEAAVSGKLTEEWRISNARAVTRAGSELVIASREAHLRKVSAHKPRPRQSSRRPGVELPEVEIIRDIPDSWGWALAAHVVQPGAEIVYGIVQPGPKLESGVPYVRGMDIEGGVILIHQLMKTSLTIAKRYERAALKGGDVLLGIIRATKVAIVPGELEGANITQGTARLRPSEFIRTKYLARVLEAPLTQKWLHDCYRGIDMPGLNLADVRRTPIPLPSVEEQDEIIRRTDGLLARAKSLERQFMTALACTDRLTSALLHDAFHGRLVQQDSDEQSATMLVTEVRNRSAEEQGTSQLRKNNRNDRDKRKPKSSRPVPKIGGHIHTSGVAGSRRRAR